MLYDVIPDLDGDVSVKRICALQGIDAGRKSKFGRETPFVEIRSSGLGYCCFGIEQRKECECEVISATIYTLESIYSFYADVAVEIWDYVVKHGVRKLSCNHL